MEVKNSCGDMVSQKHTPVLGLSSRWPYRFGGVRHHREGWAEEVARLFLTLASRQTAEEAGFITCYSHSAYLLPRDQEGTNHVSAEVERILSWHHSVRGRMTFVSRLRLPSNIPQAGTGPFEAVPELLMKLGLRRSARLLENASTSLNPTGDGSSQHTSRGIGRRTRVSHLSD